MLDMMHFTERYGYISRNGQPIPPEEIARYCGIALEQYQALLAELDEHRVPDRTSNQTIFSHRMVEDEKRRSEWRKRQKVSRKRNAQPIENCDVTHDVTQMSQPSSSSSSSSKEVKPKTLGHRKPRDGPIDPLFESFWQKYPKKTNKKKAFKAWCKLPDEYRVMAVAAVDNWARSPDWRDPTRQQFIPYPATWLNGELFLEEPLMFDREMADKSVNPYPLITGKEGI